MGLDLEFFPTPAWMTRALLKYVPELRCRVVLEPCAGAGHIADVLEQEGRCNVARFDIAPDHTLARPLMGADDIPRSQVGDATDREWWIRTGFAMSTRSRTHERVSRMPWWTVTNPPFSKAPLILPLARSYSPYGVAMLLRMSYHEPADNRGSWLKHNPPHLVIYLPRDSFRGRGNDQISVQWNVWRPTHVGAQTQLEWVTHAEKAELERRPLTIPEHTHGHTAAEV